MRITLELERTRFRTSKMKPIARDGRRKILFTKGREGIWKGELADHNGQVTESFHVFRQVPYLQERRRGATFTVFASAPQDGVVKLEVVVPGSMDGRSINLLVQHLQLEWYDMWRVSRI